MLVYKQTVLPLTQYVSFVICLTNMHELDKRQVLQHRASRICYDIQNPKDIGISQLHEMLKKYMLYKRRMVQLLGIIYDARANLLYQINLNRNTRRVDNYMFEIKRANLALYSKSPYYIGYSSWNNLPKYV